MSGKIKVEATSTDRSDKEVARAAPVSLPAGSYDVSELSKKLDDSALAKNDEKRDAMRADIVDKANETPRPDATLGVPPGYKREKVEDKSLAVEEDRVVFDTAQREEAEAAQEDYQPPIDPAKADDAPAKKGE